MVIYFDPLGRRLSPEVACRTCRRSWQVGLEYSPQSGPVWQMTQP